ncbi:MAG: hypothetical protein HY681_10985 [Chloroflexi bacterium]|nr:hypothetical protein [Chloroflexota bacterium]
MTQPNQPVVGRTRHTELTIDQIAEMQPGLGMLMPQIGDRYWVLYYAAKGGNWPLARHQLNEIRGLMRMGALTRPRYADHLNAFINGHVAAIEKAIEQKDFGAFDAAYRRGVEAANRYHELMNHAEIVWELPDEAPKQLRLMPPKPSTSQGDR